MEELLVLDLQRFAEDGAEPAEESAPAAAEAQTDSGAAANPEAGSEQARPAFADLIAGEYRQDYEAAVSQRVKQAIDRRFREKQGERDQYQKMQSIMGRLAQKYHVEAADVDGIAQHLDDDDSLYAEEASKLGVPVSVAKEIVKLRAANQQAMTMAQEQAAEQARLANNSRIARQALELKKDFPDFDLITELSTNEKFYDYVNRRGMPVDEAYFATHGREIQEQSMKYAAQQATRNVAASVQAGASRPAENGLKGGQGASMAVDVAHMTREQREAIRKRIHSGEAVTF